MAWLFPSFLAGACAIGIPIALHLLRRWPRRPVPFPSLRFLTRGSIQTESRWQRLRRWIVLALRCAVFLLLAAAFGRPFRLGERGRPSRAVVVVADTAFALQAQDRWPQLTAWAGKQLGEFADSDQLGVVVNVPEAHWAAPLSGDTKAVLQTLAGLKPSWEPGRLESALRLAGEALQPVAADQKRIIVITDHRREAWSGTDFATPLPAGIEIAFAAPPAPLQRQAALSSPTVAAAGEQLRTTVTVHNYTEAQSRTLRIFRDAVAAPLRELTLHLDSKEVRTVTVNLPIPADQPADLRFSLDPDDLPGDDTVYTLWRPSADGTLLVDRARAEDSGAYDYLAAALAVTADRKPQLRVAAMPAGAWAPDAIALIRNDQSFTSAAAARLDAFLDQGGVALIFATGGPLQLQWLDRHGLVTKARAGPAAISDWTMDHPLVTALGQRRIETLLNWRFQQAWELSAQAATPIAFWAPHSLAIAQAEVGRGAILYCGFIPDRSGGDWPVGPSFVPFVHQALAYLFQTRQATSSSSQVGQPIDLGAPAGQWQALAGPAASQPAVPVKSPYRPTMPGIYDYLAGAEHHRFAVNLVPEASDLAPWPEGQPWLGLVSHQPAVTARNLGAPLEAAEAERKSSWWWWAIVAAAAVMLCEMMLANRTAR